MAVWPSLKVVKSWARATGMVVLRGINRSTSPPMVSIPRESGITSSSSKSSTGAIASQQVGLKGGPDGDHPVRVDVDQGLPAEQLRHPLPHQRHPGRATHQDHRVDLLRPDPGVPQGAPAGGEGAVDQGFDQGLEGRRGPGSRSSGGRPAGRVPGPRSRSVLSCSLAAQAICMHPAQGAMVHFGAPRRSRPGPGPTGPAARSRSSPPRAESPPVARTSKTPRVRRRMEMSKVPPPRS